MTDLAWENAWWQRLLAACCDGGGLGGGSFYCGCWCLGAFWIWLRVFGCGRGGCGGSGRRGFHGGSGRAGFVLTELVGGMVVAETDLTEDFLLQLGAF